MQVNTYIVSDPHAGWEFYLRGIRFTYHLKSNHIHQTTCAKTTTRLQLSSLVEDHPVITSYHKPHSLWRNSHNIRLIQVKRSKFIGHLILHQARAI